MGNVKCSTWLTWILRASVACRPAMLLVCCLTLAGASVAQVPVAQTPIREAPVSAVSTSPDRSFALVGHETCANCHLSEAITWRQTAHATLAAEMVDPGSDQFHPRAAAIGARLGIQRDRLANHQRCVRCHGGGDSRFSPVRSVGGVSCEACHGAADRGDGEGWLDIHNDFGAADGLSDESVEHRGQRRARCTSLGMRHPGRMQSLIRVCYECHCVSDEELVQAGHPTGSLGFDYLTWFQGEVLHGRLATNQDKATDPAAASDRRADAEHRCRTYVLSQLIDVEVNLRNLAAARHDSAYSVAAAIRIASAVGRLRQICQRASLPYVELVIRDTAGLLEHLFRSHKQRDTDRLVRAAERIQEVVERFERECDANRLKPIAPLVPRSGISRDRLDYRTRPVNFVRALGHVRPVPLPLAAGGGSPAPVDLTDRGGFPNLAGHDKCATCHRAEVKQWLTTPHATIAFDVLRISPNAAIYADKLDIPADRVTKDSLCLDCHATRSDLGASEETSDRHRMTSISCEACHGAAGGTNGWLNRHASYGNPGNNRQHETSLHRRQRRTETRRAGMRRAEDAYQLAKACYQCHVVDSERLVHVARHKAGRLDFEWTDAACGPLRHNFHIDPTVNALVPSLWSVQRTRKSELATGRRETMFVVGQLVDIELSLAYRATATTRGYVAATAGRIAAAHGRLRSLPSLAPYDGLSEYLDELTPWLADMFTVPESGESTKGLQRQLQALASDAGSLGQTVARTLTLD